MEVVEALTWRGGVADAAVLVRLTSRAKVRSALRNGTIERATRGRYVLPDADEARRAAARLSGVASHLSAAQLNGGSSSTGHLGRSSPVPATARSSAGAARAWT